MGKRKKITVYKKELEIIWKAMEIKENSKKQILNSPTIINIIKLLETFIQDKKLICYGGIAINNILPTYKQFYKKGEELPDYDFFSKDALKDAKELANIYYKNGFDNVEAKSGLHEGTYKVYVNFLQVADITQLETIFFDNIKKKSIEMDKILYAPPNFLRMSVYLELSRPDGDISRWEKIYNRLQLLNKYHPLKGDCRSKETDKLTNNLKNKNFKLIQNILIKFDVLFFGGLAINSYKKFDKRIDDIYTFDAFTDNINSIEYYLKENVKGVEIIKVNNNSKLLPDYISVKIDNILYANIYKTNACYSYNVFSIKGKRVKIATIFTILSMYLTFLFDNQSYQYENRLLCLCEILLSIYKKNRLKNKGLLRNYSLSCYGKQETFETIIIKRNELFEKLKKNKNSKEYEKWFLKYTPDDSKVKPKSKPKAKTVKKKSDNKKGGKNKNTLLYFYFETCPHCIDFETNVWKQLIKDKSLNDKITFEKIHKDNEKTQTHNVTSFPTLILNKNNNNNVIFDKKRNIDNIKLFINGNID